MLLIAALEGRPLVKLQGRLSKWKITQVGGIGSGTMPRQSPARRALRVPSLQRPYVPLPTLQRRNPLGCRAGRGKRGNGRNTLRHRGASDGLLIEPWLRPRWRINDQANALPLDKIHHIRTTFFYFVNPLDSHACGFDHVARTRRSHQRETHIHKLAGNLRHMAAVMVWGCAENS